MCLEPGAHEHPSFVRILNRGHGKTIVMVTHDPRATFAVTPGLIVQGVLYAMVMGLVGGLLPSVHAARRPIAAAFRAL